MFYLREKMKSAKHIAPCIKTNYNKMLLQILIYITPVYISFIHILFVYFL